MLGSNAWYWDTYAVQVVLLQVENVAQTIRPGYEHSNSDKHKQDISRVAANRMHSLEVDNTFGVVLLCPRVDTLR